MAPSNMWHFYVRKGQAYVPTVARTDAGLFLDIDPVADDGQRQKMIASLIESFIREDGEASDNAVRLCKCAPFGRPTWNVVDQLPDALRERYWKEVQAGWGRFEDSDLNHLIDELMAEQATRSVSRCASRMEERRDSTAHSSASRSCNER